MNSYHLCLSGSNDIEWTQYIYELKRGGMCLSAIGDQLSWTWNKQSGDITTKEAYSTQWHAQPLNIVWCHTVLWKWKSPLKYIYLFMVGIE